MQQEMSEHKISEGIYVYKNAIPDRLCDEIWDFYYSHISYASAGRTSGGFYPETKNTLDFHTEVNKFTGRDLDEYQRLDGLIYESLKKTTAMYMETYEWLKGASLADSGYLWQMYRKGDGFYKEHVDGDQWTEHVKMRVLAVVAYVNTVEQGGETYFRLQDVAVKPEKGAVCLFPAHWQYPHQAMVPLSSDKLIISSFVNAV